MITAKGKTVCPGIAVGQILVIRGQDITAAKQGGGADSEWERVMTAIAQAQKQLKDLYRRTLAQEGEETASIFEIHQMMLEDEDYLDAIRDTLQAEDVSAEAAVDRAGEQFAAMFGQMDDDYMRARAADVRDISRRLVQCLTGTTEEIVPDSPVILIAEELLPGDIMGFDKDQVLAAVTVGGAVNSHASILARSRGIPAIVHAGVELTALRSGMTVIVDGDRGLLIVEPDTDTLRQAQETVNERRRAVAMLPTDKALPLELCVNISTPAEAKAVLDGADGVGLFRTEFLFMGRQTLPDEEEQFLAYTEALRNAGGKKVIIRTMDIGADKRTDALPLPDEENPALGCRGIRLSFANPDIFRTQLRALLRAAAEGALSIMFPMTASEWEVKKLRRTVEQTATELQAAGIPCRIPPLGIMIETPAAVMIADRLAPLVDFFSVGTNDLTQYTLALDRQNGTLDDYFDARHEAVLRLIAIAADHAHKAGIPIGICGELATDTAMTARFLKIGIDELSVSPALLPVVRAALLKTADE